MSLLLPALTGGALALTFLFASDKSEAKVQDELDSLSDDEKDALKTTAAAVDAEDWMLAVVEAIKSNSDMAMREVAAALKKAGLKEESADLLEVAKETAAKKKAPKAPKKVPVLAKPKDTLPKPSTKSVEDAKAKEAQARKEYEAKKAKDAAAKKAADAAAKKAADKKAKEAAEKKKLKEQAVELKKHLAATGRYKENKSYVTAYQKNNGLLADGMYGPATARSFWSKYKLVPVNPFYWSSSTASKDVAAYRTFLDTIAADEPKHQAEVTKLKGTVGR